MTCYRLFVLGILCLPSLAGAQEGTPKPLEFQLTFSKDALATPFTGRVFVVASKSSLGDAPARINWFKPEPFFAMDVTNWQPQTPLDFKTEQAFPAALSKLPAGKYNVQVIADNGAAGDDVLFVAQNVQHPEEGSRQEREVMQFVANSTGGVAVGTSDLGPLERHLRSLPRDVT